MCCQLTKTRSPSRSCFFLLWFSTGSFSRLSWTTSPCKTSWWSFRNTSTNATCSPDTKGQKSNQYSTDRNVNAPMSPSPYHLMLHVTVNKTLRYSVKTASVLPPPPDVNKPDSWLTSSAYAFSLACFLLLSKLQEARYIMQLITAVEVYVYLL